ncbi:MAG: tetratricopeptide repeat protein [Desulfuromonadaceae bacterium]|nr:tetratricopeptide repeat protein [Desulfuromonadaceae bacterium]
MLRTACLLLVVCTLSGCAAAGPSKNDMAKSHYQMGQSYMATQDYSSALKELLEGVKLQPDNPEMHYLLAQAYQRKSAYVQAETHYLRALKLKSEDPYIYNNLGALYLDMQRWDDAANYFRKAADDLVFQYPVRALTGLGIAHHRAGEYTRAVMAYKEALKRFPNNLSVMYLLAQSYVKLHKYPLAEEILEEALNIDPLDNVIRFEYARTLLEQDKRTLAREQFLEIANREDKTQLGKEARDYVELLK